MDCMDTDLPVTYKGYAIYQRMGAPIWEKNIVSGHEFVAGHKPGRGFRIVRVDSDAPPVLSSQVPGTLKAAKELVDFMLKFPFYGTSTGRISGADHVAMSFPRR